MRELSYAQKQVIDGLIEERNKVLHKMFSNFNVEYHNYDKARARLKEQLADIDQQIREWEKTNE